MKMKDTDQDQSKQKQPLAERMKAEGAENGHERDRARDTSRDSVATVPDGSDQGSALVRPGQIVDALQGGVIELDEFVERVREGMRATRPARAKTGELLHEPDWPTRLAYIKFVTETVEGLPVKRQEIITRKVTTDEDLARMAEESPAFRRTLRKLVERAERSAEDLSAEGGYDGQDGKPGE